MDKVIEVNQAPIGRTPRSILRPTRVFSTTFGIYSPKRGDAKMRGYTKSRFSFNVKGGRCDACWGDGVTRIEMHFLSDIYVPCEV